MKKKSESFQIALEFHIGGIEADKYIGEGGFDVIDIAHNYDMLEDFAIMNIIKYVIRYRKDRNKKDLLKAGNYMRMLYEKYL